MIIVGAGVAGLSASLASIERILERGTDDARIAVLERASRADRGGNTRYQHRHLPDEGRPHDQR
ncbi:hypothetical protein [Candidatus Spongiisocius sp.]|uniref:hypothetical protein n=1 Tax=Candidatus Spongiisocius sp. TaxID=3101273 RepID=UPI003B5B83E2